jgi:long-chain acyl-CoA synthetase
VAFLVKNCEIQTAANQIARLLEATGMSSQGVVSALLPNCPEMLFCYRAVSCSGKTWTPISCQLPVDDVRYILEDSGAEIFIAHARFRDLAIAAVTGIPAQQCFSVGGEIEGFQPLEAYLQLPDSILEAPLAGSVMMYTSGTTGRPKGVSRPTQEPAPPPALITRMGMAMMQHFLGDNAGGTHLVAAPLYHAAAITYCDGAVECGADIVIMAHYDSEEFLQLVDQHQVVSTFLVPTHFVRLLKLSDSTRHSYKLDSLQLISHGGAPTPIHIKRAMIKWLGLILFESYGGTEGGGIHISSEDWLAHPGSVGKPGPHLSLTILDEQARPCPTGSVGNVYMASADPFEYLNDPDKTAAIRQGS